MRGRSRASATRADRIRVATFNLRSGDAADGPNHWDRRKGVLLEAVRSMDPHIMGVQECQPFQGDEIKMGFPHLERVGLGRYHGVADKDRPSESRSGEHSDIFFDSRRLLAESCGTFWHSSTPDVPASITWGNSLPRVTTWVILRFRENGWRIAFFCTHLHWGEPYVEKVTDLLVSRIGLQAGGLPTIVVGDFNLGPDSPLHARLTQAAPFGLGLTDAWNALGVSEQDAGTFHAFSGEATVRMDWILADARFVPVSVQKVLFRSEGRFPSDHFPVVGELELSV